MAYTKAGPFVDGGAPYLTAAFFNNVETALAATEGAANTVNPVTGWFHVDQYGAVGDGTTIDRAAIQAAINAAAAAYTATGAMQRVYFPAKTFLVDAVSYLLDDGTTVSGAVSLRLPDGVEVFGSGTIKTKNGAYGSGASYGIIRSTSSGTSNIAITGLTFDGNTANNVASQQCNNIALTGYQNVRITNTRHVAANGNAIIVTAGSNGSATNVEICDNTVLAAAMIGIQCSHFNGLIIRGNYVANTTNNGIDIYGNNGSTTVDGTNFTITGNTITGGLVGIFPETVAQGVITGNVISNCTESGVHINRINGQPHDILVAENTITGTPYGVYVTGDTGGIVIRGNTVTGFTSAGVQLGGGGGNCSYIVVDGNTLNANGATVPLVNLSGNQVAYIRIRGTTTIPINTDRKYDYRNNATTSVNITVEPMYPFESTTTGVQVASGGTFTITAPPSSGGTLIIHAAMGGAWSSIWQGVWVSDAARVDVTATASDFTTPGQAVASVTGSTTSLTITVTAAASGSVGIFDYTFRKVSP